MVALTAKDLSMPLRFWAGFAAALMSISSLALLTFTAGGVAFTSSAFFTTFASAWILPTTIAFLLAPFLLCYFSPLIADIMIVFGVVFLLFSAFECASAWYMAVGPGASAAGTLLAVLMVLCTMVNLLGAFAFLLLVSILRSGEYLKMPRPRAVEPEIADDRDVEMTPLQALSRRVVSGRT